MKSLSVAVAAFAVLSLASYLRIHQVDLVLLGVAALICAYVTWRSGPLSTFLKIFLAIFSTETIVFGLLNLADEAGLWPESLADFAMPNSVPVTVAMFSILVYGVSHLKVVRAMTVIADRFFRSNDMTETRVWPSPRFSVLERRLAIGMVTFLVLINQAEVLINIRLSFFGRDWLNAIQQYDARDFWRLLFWVFLPLAAAYIAATVFEYFVKSMLIIRWRRWLTNYYISRWLDRGTHYLMSLIGGNADNPDQRISEDVNRFIDGSDVGYGIYSYSILLISTLSSLVSFAIILWVISASFTIPGTQITVPGFLFWIALLYAGLGTGITHWLGHTLTGLLFTQQRYEANLRFSLARLREYSEQVALLGGEAAERRSAMSRFGQVFANYVNILDIRKKLLIFTNSYGQISPFIPYIVAAPFFFARKIEFGVLNQTAQAFGQVNSALNFFVNYYTYLADYRAVLDRLTSFDASIERARALETARPRIEREKVAGQEVMLDDLTVSLPDGRTIVSGANLTLSALEPTLIVGPSGSGKSTLMRAISGIWPFGHGGVERPENAKLMLLPQKPYIPIGTLRAALTYPSAPDIFSDDRLQEVMRQVQLGEFVDQLDEEANWSQRLSGGEQQRLSLARALLAEPDWLFLDEATASLDEASEAVLYGALPNWLPNTTIVSIGHRSTLVAFHKRSIEMRETSGGKFTVGEVGTKAAAE